MTKSISIFHHSPWRVTAVLFLLSGFVISPSIKATTPPDNSNVIADSRRIDWTQAGVIGGIPSASWAQCGSTIAAGASIATINAAIQSCPANHYVLLGAGTFNLTAGILMKSNVALRGMGADQTFLIFSGDDPCSGGWATVCFENSVNGSSDYAGAPNDQPGGSQSASWTAGYAPGATQITLANVGSNGISQGQYILLDQNEDTSTNNGFFACENNAATPPCSMEGGAGNPGRIVGGIARQQIQMVKVTAINNNVYTITPGLYAPNYASDKLPGAWWPSSLIQNAGLEDLSVDATNSGGITNVSLFNAVNVWVKGTRQIRSCICSRDIISMGDVAHATIQNNYFYGTSGHSVNYGVEAFTTSDDLIINNIFQHVVAPMMLNSNQGNVYAYNYDINNTYDDGRLPIYHWMAGGFGAHAAGVLYNLIEGNIAPAVGGDAFHGNPVMNTVFRNYLLGSDPGRIDNLVAFSLMSWARYWNVIGNVLGTPGVTTAYAGGSPTIYNIGNGDSENGVVVPDDPLVISTLMRWGNYDTVTGAVRWNTSEVPSGSATFPNPVPSNQALPPSLFLSSKPSWWPSGKPWPPIGPDVTGGNIPGVGGHVYTLPAEDCFRNVMGGPADGSGNPLSFNAASCYGSAGGNPATTPTPTASVSVNPTVTLIPTPIPTPPTTPTEEGFASFKNVFNPEKESVTIRYSIPGGLSSDTTLAVYDRQGTKVKELTPNTNSAVWDGKNSDNQIVGSGTYVLILKKGDKTFKKKVVIVK